MLPPGCPFRLPFLAVVPPPKVGLDDLQAEYGPVTSVLKLVPSDDDRASMVAALEAAREEERRVKAEKKAAKKEKRKAGGGAHGEGQAGRAAGLSLAADAGGASEGKDEEAEHAARAAKRARAEAAVEAKAGKAAPSVGAVAGRSGFLGAVLSEAKGSLAASQGKDAAFKGLFHGAGSQKPRSATEQFIVVAGKRGVIG